jgi:aerobic-type carbon monoxide dehydrogenase small subunit (CoxS/CutS family)
MKIARPMQINVNGTAHAVNVAGHETLLDVLRDGLGLTGAKLSCGRGECGACTVLLSEDGGRPRRAVYSCLALAAACDGAHVTTIEGLGDGALHPLQQAFIERDAVQCGFCTPGQLLAATALLDRTLTPTESEIRSALSGNLCRCGTYPNIVLAIQDAARVLTTTAVTRSPVVNSASSIDAAR